jgi:hypothetical protein
MLKAKDMMIDFLNYAFLLALVSFCIIFFAVGDRFTTFYEFLKMLVPFSLFGIFFLVFLKIKRNDIRQLRVEETLEEIVIYLTRADIIKDRIIIIFLASFIIITDYFTASQLSIGVLQSFIFLLAMLIWRIIIFRKREDTTGVVSLTNFDAIKDEIYINTLPVILLLISISGGEVNSYDILEAVLIFITLNFWHKILFKKSF